MYIIDYTDEHENMYKLGKSDDMEKRKKIYNTHTIYKKNIILIKEILCPLQYETCLRSMLYNYRIKNRKDFYECNISKIEKAFQKCEDSIKCMNQNGGSNILSTINIEIEQLKKKKEQIIIKIEEYNKLLY